MVISDNDSGKYPSFIEALVLIVLFMVLQMSFGIAVGRWGAELSLSHNGPSGFIINFLLIPLITGIAVISYGLWRGGYKWVSLLQEKRMPLNLYIIILLTSVGLSLFLAEVDKFVRFYYPMTEIWAEIFQNIYQANIILSFVGIVVIPPLIEEILFRGIILKGFLKIYSPALAISLSSLLFALIHINIWQMITAFIAGIFLGWVYYRSKSLFLVIFSHVVFNAIAVFGNRYVSIQDITGQIENQSLWLFSAGLLIIMTGSYFFHRTLKSQSS